MFKRWLHFFAEEDGRTLKEENGHVSSTIERVPIDPSMEGWMDISVGWERDAEMIGNIRSFGLPQGFFRGAAYILRHESYKKNIERRLFLIMTKLYLEYDALSKTYKRYYRAIYRGELDFSSFKDHEHKVEIKILEGGLSQKLKANKSSRYEFPMDNSKAITIKWDGIRLEQTGNFAAIDGVDISKKTYGTNFWLPLSNVSTDGQAQGLYFFSSFVTNITGLTWDQRMDQEAFFAKADELNETDIDAIIEGKLIFTCTKNDPRLGFRTRFITSLQTINDQNAYPCFDAGAVAVGTTYEKDVAIIVPLKKGEKLFLEGIYYGGATGAVDINIRFEEGSRLSVKYKNRYKTTYVKAFLADDMFGMLTERISGSADNAQSDLLRVHRGKAVTCGDAIRGLPGAKIKTNMMDFFTTYKYLTAGGMGVEKEKLRFEGYAHFLDPSDPIDLGEVKKLSIEEATELMANNFKIGYEEQNYDNVNGKKEFNNTHFYTTDITKVVKDASFICPYRTDPFGAEIMRLNLEGKTTTDSDSDNDVFVIDIDLANPVSYTTTYFLALSGSSPDWNVIFVKGVDELEEILTPGSTFVISNSQVNNGTYTVDKVERAPGSDGFNIVTLESVRGEMSSAVTISLMMYELYRDPAMTITGVPDPETIFNVRLSPKNILYTNSSWINSMMYGFEGTKLKFQTTQKNDELKVVKGGVTIEEKADYVVGNNRLFIPKWLVFDTDVDPDIIETLAENPNRCFRFVSEGVFYKGFTWRAGVAPDTGKEQSFKLLSTPDNDFTKRIR